MCIRRARQGAHPLLARSWTDETGTTAVEFGIVAIPFILILVGLLEMGLMFAAGTVLEGGTQEAGRMVRTGQIQAAGDPEAAFRAALCDHVDTFMNCDDLTYEVIELGDAGFHGASAVEPVIDEDGVMHPRPFDPGEENSVVLIRAAYLYPIKTPLFAHLLADSAGNRKLFLSTVVIRNEPYAFTEGS